eukprot:TRINITY_DN748_c0_g1_i4.p1 TRINITY_DN748_c0_g1~~TRINITY_DN748_c0_g1_i4.p1  ORF type:complete len:188 (-),score=31.67 TRINITY_DN748_c0_g1_i4:85-648(-)
MPKQILTSRVVKIPDGVTVTAKARTVHVFGPRGKLVKDFGTIQVDIQVRGKNVVVERWWGKRKQVATVRTVASHINNMITGVTKGYRFKMRFVYAHFPINAAISDKKDSIEIRNFLGEKVVRRVTMLPGVTVERSEKVKDEIILEGNDLNNVSQSAANIHMSTLVKRKDIRKFLDGIYVSEKGPITD